MFEVMGVVLEEWAFDYYETLVKVPLAGSAVDGDVEEAVAAMVMAKMLSRSKDS